MNNLTSKNDNKSMINIPPNRSYLAGELAPTFNLADKEGNLNFTLLTCNLKITCLSCHTLYENKK